MDTHSKSVGSSSVDVVRFGPNEARRDDVTGTGSPRMLPILNDLNRAFWTGGASGELHIFRCQECRRWIHPPNPMCGGCGARSVHPEPVSGRARVFSFTINHYEWNPAAAVPYVIAMVELEEQEDIRLNTNLVGCPPSDVYVGMPVRVLFEQQGEFFIPLFAPKARSSNPSPVLPSSLDCG